MKFTGPFVTEDLPGGEDVWKVYVGFAFIDSSNIGHYVSPGFITDGGSIPRLLWPIAGHPRSCNAGQAYCLHDKLYREKICSRKRSDEILAEGMKVLGSSAAKRVIVYYSLRIAGWYTWKRYMK